jgi:hypothetical protein
LAPIEPHLTELIADELACSLLYPSAHAHLQAEVFEQFLAGSTLEECYAAVAAVANRWLDMLDTQVGGRSDV